MRFFAIGDRMSLSSILRRNGNLLSFVILDYLVVLVLLIGAVLVVRSFVHESQRGYKTNTLAITQLSSVRASVLDARRILWKAAALRDRDFRMHTLPLLQSKLLEIDRTWRGYDPEGISSPAEEAVVARLRRELLPRFATIVGQASILLKNGEFDATARLVRDEHPLFDELDAALDETIGTNQKQAADNVQSQADKFGRVLWITLGAGGAVCIFMGFAIRRLARQRNDAREAVRSNALLTDQLFDSMPGIGILVDTESNIVRVNSAFTRITGYSSEEAQHMKTLALRSERNAPALFDEIWHSLRAAGHWSGEFWYHKKSGESYLQNAFIKGVRGADGSVTHYALVGTDITFRRRQEEEMKWSATHDALTGLVNRRLFGDRLEHALSRARRISDQVAVLYIDLDGFKSINDTLGHEAGDQVLVTVAKRLVSGLRDSDTVARLGGDEFAVILENCPVQQAGHIAGTLIASIGLPIELGIHRGNVTGSIGISTLPQDGNLSAAELVAQADQAMYEAKQSGKNQYRVFAQQQQSVA
jgi:diguanylate cyclase (GGDEF)-like protein/PAS domain S-box-containing protein